MSWIKKKPVEDAELVALERLVNSAARGMVYSQALGHGKRVENIYRNALNAACSGMTQRAAELGRKNVSHVLIGTAVERKSANE